MTDFKPSERDDGLIDWITDFDILDEGYVTDPAWVWNLLRDACPVAHTDRRGSTWLPVSFSTAAPIRMPDLTRTKPGCQNRFGRGIPISPSPLSR